MKTKSFLLATAGATVDGRTIDEAMLQEMADSYDPKTYGARLNIEHIRGATGQLPFRAFGDVLSLSTAEVDVNFNGKPEKRLGLYGTFDVTDDAKALNDASQKVYPSIEIEPNFAGKGFAYLMGCALTDSPASIATDRLEFNRQMPGTIHLSRDESALLEFEDETGVTEGGTAFLGQFKSLLDGFAAKFTKSDPTPAPKPKEGEDAATAFDFTQLSPLLEQLGQTFAASIDGLRSELRTEVDQLGIKFAKLEKAAKEDEGTPVTSFRKRPQSNGNASNFAKVF